MNGIADDLKATKVKIFKWDESMIIEETTLATLINMGLAMAKKSVSDALQIPSFGYPNFKKCYGLELISPLIQIQEGFLFLSTNLGVSPASFPCEDDDTIYPQQDDFTGFVTETMTKEEI